MTATATQQKATTASLYPKTFYHPHRPRLRVKIKGKTASFMQFEDGRVEAHNELEEQSLRAACGSRLYEDDLPAGTPDLVIDQTGFRTRSTRAYQEATNRLIRKGGANL